MDPQVERHRQRGLRHVRRLSNWTAAALVAATAVTAGYFARGHTSAQQVASVTGSPSQASSQGPAAGPSQRCVTVPVAVSGGSGVPATAPTRTCAPGTGGGTASPTVIYVNRHENERD